MLKIANEALAGFAEAFTSDGPREQPARWEWQALAVILIVAAVLRFWGLGNVGLHAPDEDTMALPAVHLAEHGEPRFPSGMYYGRAFLHTYLIAGTINLFGNSEWAMRLPSAACGVLVVFLSFFVGRRFLQPIWNLAFVTTVALLPEMIVQSQNARMYIFLLACVAGYLICVFNWERTRRTAWLLGALVGMVLGIHLQPIMVFLLFVFFYPALRQGDLGKAALGIAAAMVALFGMRELGQWYAGFYIDRGGDEVARLIGAPGATIPVRSDGPTFDGLNVAYVTVAIALAGGLAWLVMRACGGSWGRWIAAVLVSLGMGAQFFLNYHLAIVLLVAAAVLARRTGLKSAWPFWVVLAVFTATAIAHVAWLRTEEVGTRGIILAMMVGEFSIWSFINYAAVSYGATALATLGAIATLWKLAQGERVSDAWLLAFLGAWVPLFLIGYFDVYPEFRYMTPALLPLLIAAFATAQALSERIGRGDPRRTSALAVGACLLVVNPVALSKVVNPGYDVYPDHKGAAELVRGLSLQPDDVLVAEDVITQTYYLGRVDYFLTDFVDALTFARVIDGEVLDIYTDTRVLATAAQLQALLADPQRGDVYIIGSGEGFVDGRRPRRAEGVEVILETLEVIYEGRDGRTRVWKVPRPPES